MTLAYADAHAALLDSLDARVRETVRRDGVDPQAEVGAVRRIAELVVTAHDERSLTGAVMNFDRGWTAFKQLDILR